MNLHSLKRSDGSRRKAKRVARGESSGSGRTAGRGNKGQMSRSGHKRKPSFEGGQMRLVLRIPKRGFNSRDPVIVQVVNVGLLSKLADGAVADSAALLAAGLIKNAAIPVKILGNGEVTRKLTVKAAAFSASAKSKIEAAGGKCEAP